MTESEFTAADQRPLRLKFRSDLRTTSASYRGVEYRVIHDPVSERFHYVREEEFAILRQLDGLLSAANVIAEFERLFSPKRLGASTLRSFLADAVRAGLVTSKNSPSLGAMHRAEGQTWGMRLHRFAGMLSPKLWRFDPSKLLDRLGPLLSPLFSVPAFAIWCTALATSVYIVLLHRDSVAMRLPQLGELFAPANLPWLLLTAIAVKSWHELGHAVACRTLNVRCREAGVQWLLFAPAFYCDTTDAWRLPHKYHRMLISAGGIYFEGFAAAAAALLYAVVHPGFLSDLCLNVLFTCTVGTLLVNANVFLRFDGYYLLADAIEIPDLDVRAAAHLRASTARILGDDREIAPGPWEDRVHVGLACWGAITLLARTLLIVGALFALRGVFQRVNLDPIGDLVVIPLLLGLLASWGVFSFCAALISDNRARSRNSLRTNATLGFVSAIVGAVLSLVPLPSWEVVEVLIQPAESRTLYVSASGTLMQAIPAGKAVKEGDVLFTLRNDDLSRNSLASAGEVSELTVRQRSLATAEKTGDARTAATQRAIAAALESAEQRQRRLEEMSQRLEVRATRDGVVLSAIKAHSSANDPLQRANLGMYLETGSALATIADRSEWVADSRVAQTIGRRITTGRRAYLYFSAVSDPLPAEVILVQSSVEKRNENDPQASSDLVDFRVRLKLAASTKQLQASGVHLASGLHGTARIYVESETGFEKFSRWWRTTFRFADRAGT